MPVTSVTAWPIRPVYVRSAPPIDRRGVKEEREPRRSEVPPGRLLLSTGV